MTGQPRKPRAKKATAAFLAAQTFTDEGPALREVLGTREEWLRQAAYDWTLFQFAEAIHRKDQSQMAAAVAAMSDENVELVKNFEAAQDRFRAMVEILDTAVVRIMCGIARLGIAEATQKRSTKTTRPERPA